MSSILGPQTTVELLERIQHSVSELAARTDKQAEEFRTRAARERLKQQSAGQERQRSAHAALETVETRASEARSAEIRRYEERKKRIGRAFQNAQTSRLKMIDDRIGANRYEMQKRMLQAERDRESGLSAAAAEHKAFQERLVKGQEKLAGLEQDTQLAFAGYPALSRLFFQAYDKVQLDASKDHGKLLNDFEQKIEAGGNQLRGFKSGMLISVFRHLPLWFALGICVGLSPLLRYFGLSVWDWKPALISGAACIGFGLLCHVLAAVLARSSVRELSDSLASARRLHDVAKEKAEQHYQQETQRLQGDYDRTHQFVDESLRRANTEGGEARVSWRRRCDERAVRAAKTNDQLHQLWLKRLEARHAEALTRARSDVTAAEASMTEEGQSRLKQLDLEHDRARQAVDAEWHAILEPVFEKLKAHQLESARVFPPWSAVVPSAWTPPTRPADSAKFGEAKVDLLRLCGTLPKGKNLKFPGPQQFTADMCLAFPQEGSLLIETGETGRETAVSALNNVILRLLATTPPGRLTFTILDPVGLGQNFAGVMHMADYEEQIISNRIWTQPGQIEQRLADLNEHMEKVIQMYLRNEYATIAEYNAQAGVIAEKYHFLVIADFPANFTDVAAKRLLSIASSGARCGVYMLLHWDRRVITPQDFLPNALRENCFCVQAKGPDLLISGKVWPGVELGLEAPPEPSQAIELIQRIGQHSRDSSRVEVPFSHVAPGQEDFWSEETTSELRVAIGRTGATKLQYLEMGRGTCQHGLVAGKTGSGKSTLFHVVVTNLALWCSPDEIEFYLVDFKKGVEFKCYGTHRLPHARVVAIESDREFGLSVLQRVDDELRHRGDLFRKLGVQDLPGYKRAAPGESMPRCLLVIDEFQEFFVEDDRIAQSASLLLDRIVRQGRAFGIHVLLGSQTLGGAYTVARTTLGQMVIRVALQCNESDAYLIMDESNPAPRLLSRPGEAIYNDSAGKIEGNSPFQVVWLPEEVRDDYLGRVRAFADRQEKRFPAPIVFEGNAPADVRENELFNTLLQSPPATPPAVSKIWLGAPNSIKGPTEVPFQRQSGSNLLLVGQSEDSMLAIIGTGLLALAAQHPPGSARYYLCDGTAPESQQRAFLERITAAVPGNVRWVRPADLTDAMEELYKLMKSRSEDPDPDAGAPHFLIINGLQKYGRLRYDEDFSFSANGGDAGRNPAQALNDIVSEGARLGIHVIATCDTYNNLNRYLSRKAQSEFELRVLFQMSANDSASLIDNPRASTLGLHRALYQNAQEGYLEVFRPYGAPPNQWIDEVRAKLAQNLSPA